MNKNIELCIKKEAFESSNSSFEYPKPAWEKQTNKQTTSPTKTRILEKNQIKHLPNVNPTGTKYGFI